MNKANLAGAMLATAIGLMFIAQPVFATDSGKAANTTQVKCIGGNSC
ncbi:MAG: hypothetical protein ACREQX_16640 [Candidatus Binataceae bacterium]